MLRCSRVDGLESTATPRALGRP